MRSTWVVLGIALTVSGCGDEYAPVRQAAHRPVSSHEGPPLVEGGTRNPNFRRPADPPNIDGPIGRSDARALARLPFNPTGYYRRDHPHGVMRVRLREHGWEIFVKGDPVWRGNYTSGHCAIAAVGPLKGRKIVGVVIPFESSFNGVAYGDESRSRGPLTVTFHGRSADVSDMASWPFCPIGTYLGGSFVRDDSLADFATSIDAEAAAARMGVGPDNARAVPGEYVSSRDVRMIVRWTGRAWRIAVSEPLLDGKCEFISEGPLVNGQIEGRLIPFELTDGHWITPEDKTRMDPGGKRRFKVRLDGGRAVVIDKLSGPLCSNPPVDGPFARARD